MELSSRRVVDVLVALALAWRGDLIYQGEQRGVRIVSERDAANGEDRGDFTWIARGV